MKNPDHIHKIRTLDLNKQSLKSWKNFVTRFSIWVATNSVQLFLPKVQLELDHNAWNPLRPFSHHLPAKSDLLWWADHFYYKLSCLQARLLKQNTGIVFEKIKVRLHNKKYWPTTLLQTRLLGSCGCLTMTMSPRVKVFVQGVLKTIWLA